MKIFTFAGIVFNVNNICTIQKVNLKSEKGNETAAGLQIVTVAGGMNFSFKSEAERDAKFEDIKTELRGL